MIATRARIAGAIAIAGLLCMCDGTYAIDDAEPCRNAGFAISARVHACTGDADRANDLYDRFVDQTRCSVRQPKATDFRCSNHINSYDCERVQTNGDDFDGWLNAAGCAAILSYASGKPVPDPTPSTTNPLLEHAPCRDALTAVAELELACRLNPENLTVQTVLNSALGRLSKTHSCNQDATDADQKACQQELDQANCLQLNQEDSIRADLLLPQFPACAAIIPTDSGSADAGTDG